MLTRDEMGRLFVRDPYDDEDFPQNISSAWTWQQCLRQRLGRQVDHPPDPVGTIYRGRGGRASACRSADFWSRVTRGTSIRFVNLTSLTEDNQPSPIPFPAEPLITRPGQLASLDVHTTFAATGAGVAASLTRARLVAVPSLPVARGRHGVWPGDASPALKSSSACARENAQDLSFQQPAATWSLNKLLLTASSANRVCIGGLGCNKITALTDPGFSRIDLVTDDSLIGRYHVCVDAHVVCFTISSLPALALEDCPEQVSTKRIIGVLQLPDHVLCPSPVGAIRLLVDPIHQIAPEFVSRIGGEAVANVVIGASFGRTIVEVKGAAGDAISRLRLKAHVLEKAGQAWEKSGRYV